MKTSSFIEKQAAKIMRGERGNGKCSSVFADNDCIYSYGYHYPLLFKVTKPNGDAIMIVNRRGYSSSTDRHVRWCWRVSGVSVELIGRDRDYINVVNSVEVELQGIRNEMAAKKRKDTSVFKALQWRESRAINALAILQS